MVHLNRWPTGTVSILQNYVLSKLEYDPQLLVSGTTEYVCKHIVCVVNNMKHVAVRRSSRRLLVEHQHF